MRSDQVVQGALSSLTLKTSKDGVFTSSLGNPFCCMTVLNRKKSPYVWSESLLICLLPVVLCFLAFQWKLMAACCSLEVWRVSLLVRKSTPLMQHWIFRLHFLRPLSLGYGNCLVDLFPGFSFRMQSFPDLCLCSQR